MYEPVVEAHVWFFEKYIEVMEENPIRETYLLHALAGAAIGFAWGGR